MGHPESGLASLDAHVSDDETVANMGHPAPGVVVGASVLDLYQEEAAGGSGRAGGAAIAGGEDAGDGVG